MGKVFLSATKYNPNPGQYSWNNWNDAVASNDKNHVKIIGNLAKGNFFCLMTVILDMEWKDGNWQPKRPTMKCKQLPLKV